MKAKVKTKKLTTPPPIDLKELLKQAETELRNAKNHMENIRVPYMSLGGGRPQQAYNAIIDTLDIIIRARAELEKP